MNGTNSPAEIAEIWVGNGIKKANLSWQKMLLLGIFAGMFIGFGSMAFIAATAPGGSAAETLIQKLIGASIFPAGLMMVIFCGAELFTGNNLLTLALFDKKITMGQMLKNWVIVYIGNLIGSILLAWLLWQSGLITGPVAEKAIAIAQTKTAIPFWPAFVRGILCNMLVVLACWFQAGAKNMIGKIFAVWFPIMTFVFLGFEHSVANMTYIPLGIFAGADVSFLTMWNNLIPVSLGNIVGGAIIVAGVYWYCYLRKPEAGK
ncbi:MAG: formate/nitrite transporter family protein [Eubacteriaceae bacterium]|jgi:formate/nitrite transporter